METHLGAGAGQAMEVSHVHPIYVWDPFKLSEHHRRSQDAYLLARLLAHPLTTVKTLPIALYIYDKLRLPFANGIVKTARTLGRLYEFQDADPPPPTSSDAKLWAERWGAEVLGYWDWQWDGDRPEKDWEVAEGMLKQSVGASGLA